MKRANIQMSKTQYDWKKDKQTLLYFILFKLQ
jgi:hypothetical protein